MPSTISDDSLRFATLLGRTVAAAGAMAGLLLVLVLFQFRIPYKPGFGVIILATLIGLAASVWWVGELVGRAIARQGRAGVAWGPVAGLACLGLGACSFALASGAMNVERELSFGLVQAIWDYVGKPFVFIMLAGGIPAALIGLSGATAIHLVLAWQKKAHVGGAP